MSHGWPIYEPRWMIRGSVELLKVCQPSLMEGLSLILDHVTNIEIVSPVLGAVIYALVHKVVGYLTKHVDHTLLLLSSSTATTNSSSLFLSSLSRTMTFFWAFFKSSERFFSHW